MSNKKSNQNRGDIFAVFAPRHGQEPAKTRRSGDFCPKARRSARDFSAKTRPFMSENTADRAKRRAKPLLARFRLEKSDAKGAFPAASFLSRRPL